MRPEQTAGPVGHIFVPEFARRHGMKDRTVAIAAGDLVIHPDGGSVAEPFQEFAVVLAQVDEPDHPDS
jgi:hypothetical protein